MRESQTNWAGNYEYRAERLHTPESLDQVREIVAASRKLRTLGSRHSFNDIADSPGDLICLKHMDRVLDLDKKRGTVTVEAGITYGKLCRYLDVEGCALHNLASLPHISVAGACMTGTHGSGDANGNLATAVSAVEFITADGNTVTLTRDNEDFHGAVVALGGLGVVTKLTLDIQPAFTMRQDVYEGLAMSQVQRHFDQITSSGYSVSLFTEWKSEDFTQVWIKRRMEVGESFTPPHELFSARLAGKKLHPIRGVSPENCTEQGLPGAGAWCDRLPHFRMDYMPSAGKELQTEYLAPRRYALEAIGRVARLRQSIAPLLQVCEVRTIAADQLWMSPCYRQPCVAIHFTWKQDWEHVRNLLPVLERELESCQARPHWGKLFTMTPDRIRALYERLPNFQDLLRRYDPEGKFRNAFMDSYIFADEAARRPRIVVDAERARTRRPT